MKWQKALQHLDSCYDRGVLADRLGIRKRNITMALAGTAKSVSARLKRSARREIQRLQREHVAAGEVAIYALQMSYQLRDAESEERRDEILRRCVPILEQKAEALMDVEEEDEKPSRYSLTESIGS